MATFNNILANQVLTLEAMVRAADAFHAEKGGINCDTIVCDEVTPKIVEKETVLKAIHAFDIKQELEKKERTSRPLRTKEENKAAKEAAKVKKLEKQIADNIAKKLAEVAAKEKADKVTAELAAFNARIKQDMGNKSTRSIEDFIDLEIGRAHV